MRCLMWRQHRGQLLWTAALLAAYGVLMGVVGHSADQWLANYDHWLAQLRAAGCPLPGARGGTVHASCQALLQRYRGGEQGAFASTYNFAIPVFEEGLPLAMVIIGVLVGAPLVAHEVEQRSQLVAWTQSITRRRWYTTKIGVVATGLALAGLLAGFANNRLQVPLTRGGLTRSRWPWFFSIGVVPAAETVLAFALAVAMGAWLRRTLPAIGAALVCFLALFLLTGWALRALTPSRATGQRGAPRSSWDIGGGQYHPARQYWPLHLTYVAILLLLAGATFALGWHATRARNTV
jgi:hypothetical protein